MVLESIQEIGYEWAWVGDEFGTERKLYWIDDLKIKNPGQRRAAARTSLLLTKVISNFSPLYLPMKTRSSSGILNWVRRQKRGSRKLHQSGPVRGGQSRASLDVRDHSYPDLLMRSARQHRNQKRAPINLDCRISIVFASASSGTSRYPRSDLHHLTADGVEGTFVERAPGKTCQPGLWPADYRRSRGRCRQRTRLARRRELRGGDHPHLPGFAIVVPGLNRR